MRNGSVCATSGQNTTFHRNSRQVGLPSEFIQRHDKIAETLFTNLIDVTGTYECSEHSNIRINFPVVFQLS